MTLERNFIRTNAYRDPTGKYGISSGSSRYSVKGPQGAVEFWYFNGDYAETTPPLSYKLGVLGGVEHHSKVPLYEDQSSMGNCPLTDGECYCDGSSLWAEEWHKLLVHSGSEVVFHQLEILYEHWFNNGPKPDLTYNPNGQDFTKAKDIF